MNDTQLTAQEKKVSELAAQGLSNREIATQLNIKEKTVKFHLTKVYSKLNVNRAGLMLRSYKGTAPVTPDEVAVELLMEVVTLGKAGLPYTDKLPLLKEALNNAPNIKRSVAESLS